MLLEGASQGKFVRVFIGFVYDFAVDPQKDFLTYGGNYKVILSKENRKMFYIPENFAHGFILLSDIIVFPYKCTDFYHP